VFHIKVAKFLGNNSFVDYFCSCLDDFLIARNPHFSLKISLSKDSITTVHPLVANEVFDAPKLFHIPTPWIYPPVQLP
jgi:hypothetical protein